jgi:hypothetical protein
VQNNQNQELHANNVNIIYAINAIKLLIQKYVNIQYGTFKINIQFIVIIVEKNLVVAFSVKNVSIHYVLPVKNIEVN